MLLWYVLGCLGFHICGVGFDLLLFVGLSSLVMVYWFTGIGFGLVDVGSWLWVRYLWFTFAGLVACYFCSLRVGGCFVLAFVAWHPAI